MDTDELIVRARQNCCRLCLAPDSECVPIFKSFSADKEPISVKIEACVNIKVTQADRLSSRICHVCISYLNSWQSFKNRCIASQTKQQYWLEIAVKNPSGKIKRLSNTQNKVASLSSNNKKLTTLSTATAIKNELSRPGEEIGDKNIMAMESHKSDEGDGEEEGEQMKVDLDPAEFLVKNDEDEDDEENLNTDQKLIPGCSSDSPTILTSLGLTHIGTVNPYSFLSTELGSQNGDGNAAEIKIEKDNNTTIEDDIIEKNIQKLLKMPKTLPSCSICKLAFSTRANARRHERNIHGRIINSSSMFGGRRSIIKKSQVTPEMMGIYDYTKPEKYRHLLTEQKLMFIRRNEIFLKQYQTLTCNCCTKTHPTYKNFMAHMRKKYPTLGRNFCFKCLKQFQTKAMFVSHLKKKCCINLYKLYLSDDTIPKEGPITIPPDKMGAKDLLTNKVYVCKICSKTARLKAEFRGHVSEEHSDVQKKDVPMGQCGFCGIEIEDAVERKRHFNNMECIVSLKCITCEESFDKHQSFIEHVYDTHLPQQLVDDNDFNQDMDIDDDGEKDILSMSTFDSVNSAAEQKEKDLIAFKKMMFHIDSRSPQNCKICGAHYNNYNNVLRHMESKHPDQLPETYKCTNCEAGFARMSMLREHMLDKHGKKVPKYTRRDAAAAVTNVMRFTCRMCSEQFSLIEQWIEHQGNTHSHFICCQCNFQNKNIDEFSKHMEAHPNLVNAIVSTATASNLNNSTNSLITSTNNELNTSNRYDYDIKNLSAIRNGRKMEDGIGSDEGDIFQQPAQKRAKLDIDIRECHVCHAVFNSNLGLANHMRTHNAQQQLLQQQKQKEKQLAKQATGSVSGNLEKTIKPPARPKERKASHNFGATASDLTRRVRCRLCARRFSTKKGYRKHMLIDHQVKNIQFVKCMICKAEFTHEKGLKLHIMKIHDSNNSAAIAAALAAASTTDKNFQCSQCEMNFKSEKELTVHKAKVHTYNMNEENSVLGTTGDDSVLNTESTYFWFQCRYCPSNFDTNKKLAIHTNSHDEFDSNDYSCKDCGNVYSGRKSLWVHRYKKHPLVPDPSPCIICNKTFFDRNMLEMHMKNYSHANPHLHSDHHEVDDEMNDMTDEHDDDNNEINDGDDELNDVDEVEEEGLVEEHQQVPEVRCTICSVKFTDVELFTKHMNMHEMELYTDNPLAAMFDTGPDDPNKFYESRLGANGEYMCDICTKTFPMLTAFKVHRNWHFRSDGKMAAADPSIAFYSSKKKKKDPATSEKCQFCNSLFINSNNLRRHILELHKREISNGAAPKLVIEKYLECRRCEMKFRFKAEWIAHKLEHVKRSTADSTFEWGCEICGKIVSRKERLIQHVRAHGREDDQNQSQNGSSSNNNTRSNSRNSSEGSGRGDEGGGDGVSNGNHDEHKQQNQRNDEYNSQDSNSIGSLSDRSSDNLSSNNENKRKNEHSDNKKIDMIAHVTSDGAVMKENTDSDEDDEDDDDDDDDDNDDEGRNNESEDDDNMHSSTDEDDDDDDEEQKTDDSEEDSETEYENKRIQQQSQLFSCDLCQVHFETSKELQCHVTSHFLNGPGSVILTDIPKEKKSEDDEDGNEI